MGAITTRFFRVTPRKEMGVNRSGLVMWDDSGAGGKSALQA